MSRDWIITVLKGLPVWYWPIFLWDAARVGAWWQSLPIRADALLSVGVTPKGRIVVLNVFEGDVPDPGDWTLYVPREPWTRLSLDDEGAPAPSGRNPARNRPMTGLLSACHSAPVGMVYLDPG